MELQITITACSVFVLAIAVIIVINILGKHTKKLNNHLDRIINLETKQITTNDVIRPSRKRKNETPKGCYFNP